MKLIATIKSLMELKFMKLLNIIFMMALFSALVNADTAYYNQSILGYSIEGGISSVKTSSLSDEIEQIQTINAEGDTQLLTKDAVFQYQKQSLLNQANDAWDIIIALFKLIVDIIILLMYVLEMRLLLYLFVELFPNVFIKIKDSITNWYLTKR